MGSVRNHKETVRLENREQEGRIEEKGNGARSPKVLLHFYFLREMRRQGRFSEEDRHALYSCLKRTLGTAAENYCCLITV